MDNFEVSDAVMNSQKSFQCSVCKKEFSRKFTLDMHLLIHKGLKPHSCSFCGRSFRQKGTLMRHKALHSTTAMFQCHLCNKAYRQKNVYSHHLKYTHKVSTNSLDRRKSSAQMGSLQNEPESFPVYSTSNFMPINESNGSLQDVVLSDNVEPSLSLTRDDDFQSVRRSYHKNSAEKPRYQKFVTQTDSYWRCDFCGIIMKYNFENCTRHAETHQKEFPYQCVGCSSVFFQRSELICHHSQCATYQGYLQTRLPFNQTLNDPSCSIIHCSETTTAGKSLTDITFTCIPCQRDFQTEDDFECHVKTHVQSVLGDCSNPESPPNSLESKYTPFEQSSSHLDYPSSTTMESREKLTDPYDCGNPYELINTVVAGANSVLNFMSNINSEKTSTHGPQPSRRLAAKRNGNHVVSEDNSCGTTESSQITQRFTNATKQVVTTPRKVINETCRNLKSNKLEPPLSGSVWKEKPNESSITISNVVKVKPKVDSKSGKTKALRCKICKSKFQTMYERELHHLKHVQMLSFKCTLCNLPFAGKFKLRQHLRCKHSKKYLCTNISCHKSFSYERLLELHEKMCLGERNQDFSHLSFPFPAFAPVIDLSRLSAENEKRILGVIPLRDTPNQELNNYNQLTTKPKYGIPVLSLSSSKKGFANLPIVGQFLLSK